MTLRYIDTRSTLQRFPVELVKELESVGWEEFAKYRSRLKDTNQYAEVRLLRADGSDGVRRHIGFVHAYDLQKPTFTDERFITYQSQLAILGNGDGTNKTFAFPSGQVLPDTVEIMVDGAVVDSASYTVSEDGKTVTFTTAPSGIIKSSHKLSSKAYEPTNRFGVFLFDQVEMARVIDEEVLTLVSGNSYKFANQNVVPGSVTITAESGVIVDGLDYTIDAEEGKITFKTTVTAPKAKYAYAAEPIEANSHDYGDFTVENITLSANLDTADDLANLAYKAVRFIKPSPVTLLGLSGADNYDVTVNRDTLIYYWGSINKDRIILNMQTYTAHEAAKHYVVPLYIGRVVNNGRKPMQNTVIIGGCRTAKQSPYAAGKKLGGITVDYGPETTNGNDFPTLHQSIGGMYYQRHYLAFATHDKAEEIANAGQSPSVYDDRYHESFMYIAHKYDYEIGHLDDVYAMHPQGISQKAELEMENTYTKKLIGIGDGVTKVFHIPHHAASKPTIEVDCVAQTIAYDDDYKTITFATAPAKDARICATYSTKNMHVFNVADTPITPTQLDTSTPFVGIGWGVFQKKL